MNKIYYDRSDRHLHFKPSGKDFLLVDTFNYRFSPITKFINSVNPTTVSISAEIGNLSFLNVIRALFHSGLENLTLDLVRGPCDPPAEDFLFPVSKSFGSDAVALKPQESGTTKIHRFKIVRKIPKFDFSLGIYVMSNGRDLDKLEETLKCIDRPESQETLIAVVGPESLRSTEILWEKFPYIQLIDDRSIYSDDSRIPISKKKNLVLNMSRAERIVLLHDRIRLSPNWVRHLIDDCPYFDLYTCKIRAGGNYRYLDKFGIRFSGYPTLQKRHFYLTYGEDNSEGFVDGGCVVVHARALNGARFDERLHWGEMEDVDFVLRRKVDCNVVTFDPENAMESLLNAHFRLRDHSPLQALYKVRLRRFRAAYDVMRLVATVRGTIETRKRNKQRPEVI